MSRFGAALLPVIALTTAAALVHTLTGPFLQVSTVISEDSLPARPTRMGSEIAWRRDVPNLLGVTAGVALNPGDGSVRWAHASTRRRPSSESTPPRPRCCSTTMWC